MLHGQRFLVAPAAPGSPAAVLALLDVGLACCALEVAAGLASALDARAEPLAPGAPVPPGALSVLVVSGTVTAAVAPDVVRACEALPDPRAVISYGACANTGGPYWDSYCVVPGIDRLLPVDLYVPGCPPRPEAFLEAVSVLALRHLATATAGGSGDGQ